ncbi:MAG: guanylate kinase [Acidobacteria bacterium]|nr:guanylate kinase [Acidobacteriota bacterium]
MAGRGNLIILSGPSGAGKSAIAAGVLGAMTGLRFSVSHTTRPPRGRERSGVEYHFVSRDEFDDLIRRGEFLEWAEVYGNLYGTSKRAVEEMLDTGSDVLLDIDVQGARIVRTRCPESTSVFIMPPSYRVLRERLEQRQLDPDRVIEQRLRNAWDEVRLYPDYDYLIINGDLAGAVEELKAVIMSLRCRISCREEMARAIVGTFGGADAQDP